MGYIVSIVPKKKEPDIKDVLEEKSWVYGYLAEEYQQDKEIAMTAVNNGYAFEELPEELKRDKDVIIKALEWEGDTYYCLDEDLQADRDIVRAVLYSGPECFEDIPEQFQQDKSFVLECLKANCYLYEYLNEEYQADDEVIWMAVSHGLDLEYIERSDELSEEKKDDILKDKKIIMEAINHHGGNQLAYAAEKLKDDKRLVTYAIGHGLTRFALSERLMGDGELVKKIVAKELPYDELWGLVYMPEKLRMDREFLLELIALNEAVFKRISAKINLPIGPLFAEVDEEFCRRAYQVNPRTIKYMDKETKIKVKNGK